jgi:DNA polymerase-3 subunit alpha
VPSPFVHLHVHSEYSILDSSCKIPALLDRAHECGMDAIALTDHGVMSGVIKFYRQAKKRGIKPILGCEIYVAPGDRHDRSVRDGKRFFHLVLLAQNEAGYRNLLTIVSSSHTEGFYYRPRADKVLLREHHEGLIALSACESGEIPRLLQAGRHAKAETVAREFESIFGAGNFFIEVQHHGTERDDRLRRQLIDLARRLGLPLVATSDIHYLSPDDKLAHEVLLNIRATKTLNDPDHRTFDGEGYHFRTQEEMKSLFADVPEAIENTRLIADRCHLDLEFDKAMIPPFELPEGVSDSDAYLRNLAYEGAAQRYEDVSDKIRERLDYELAVIAKMTYSTYFLIVWDFVQFARRSGISVGPGRGSAAGSLVAYCLGITSVDPLKYGLIFERFLNPDRISLPDFDIDFCIRGRDRVIDYVRQKYGGERWWERIAQIATFDRMAARSVVRDVGRVLGVPYGVADRIAKLIPFGWGLRTAVDSVAELRSLYDENAEIRQVIDIGLRLEGLTRNASTHAAGVVIAPDALSRHVPLLRLGEEEYVTQFDMIDVEAVGLLKFDFLGLRNLTLIDEIRGGLKKYSGVEICVDSIPLDDANTFKLIREGRTAGIFQLESSGMTNLIRRVQPDRFADIIALLALYRPGPLESGMTDEYVSRRQGATEISYPHPSLKEVLEDTFGLPIYQDQVMLMAQKMAGFSLAEADVLRKAMGKKNKQIMDSLQEKFIDGCLANDIGRELAERTFADMQKFSRYGFNKSHTTAYAFVSYWTAYLKANYPTHFMACLLTSVAGDTDKVAEYIAKCRDMGIAVLPPDITESRWEFTPIGDARIRFGLSAIKHVGKGAISSVLESRTGAPFASFFDFCRRVDGDGLDREALEALIKAGAFDRFGASRRGLLRHLREGFELMQVARQERQSGQESFFSNTEDAKSDPVVTEEEFDQADLLAFEKEFLGLYVTAHPIDDHRETLRCYCLPIGEASRLKEGRTATIGGRVNKLRRVETKRGDAMAFVTVEDGVDEIEITVFPRVLEAAGDLLREDGLIGITVAAGLRNGEVNLVAEEVLPLSEVPNRCPSGLTLTLDATQIDETNLRQLSATLEEHPGTAPVQLQLFDEAGMIVIRAHERFAISPSERLQTTLRSLVAVRGISFGNGNTL